MRLPLLLFFVLVGLGCQTPSNEKVYRIGFSQCTGGDEWRRAMLNDMKRELSIYPNFRLIYKDAANNTSTQIAQINELVGQDIDLLIISPNESSPVLTEAIDKVFQKGLPVILLDRKINSTSYNCFIGADNFEIGRMVGETIPTLLKKGGKVVEIWGLVSSSPAQERHKGFLEGIAHTPNIQVIKELYGQWEQDTAEKVAKSNLEILRQADLVFAHNDVMAQRVQQVCQQAGLNPLPIFVGIDGLPGPKSGLQKIVDGTLTTTFLYPTGGEEAIEIAAQILAGKATKREYVLNSIRIDRSNIKAIKAQSDKLLNQQHDIEKLGQQIDRLNDTYSSQKNVLYTTLILLALVVVFGGILLFLFREKQQSNKMLAEQNEAILKQKDEIERVSLKARQAIEDKMRFYAYISHEFKTPLSLILTPTEDLLHRQSYSSKEGKSVLEFILKNANRLLRLVDQILDLRRIDAGKIELHSSTYDLVGFCREIVNDFSMKAKKSHIDLQFICPFKELSYTFDAEKLDKVLFNILSNAFKYTPAGGLIHVSLLQNRQNIEIIISDNGEGMNEEDRENAFELFYRADQNSSFGTGLGLALSKEFVQLHQGEISVESEKGKGAVFKITLPYTNELQNTNLNKHPDIVHLIEEDSIWIDNAIKNDSDISIVIIEDNPDLLQFLNNKFSNFYQVHIAESAEKGWELILQTIPDLIISDVMLPKQDGFSLTRNIKEDFRTSHIPVILLTAKGQVDSQIEGTKAGADAYMAKPFNQQLLEEKVKNLLENRDRIQRRFSNEVTDLHHFQANERKFLLDFELMIEMYLKDSTLSVEKLSKEMGMSRVQLYRKITALTNKNVNDYIAEYKIKKAKQLLADPSKNITEIAYALGFNNPGYFTTFFKQKTDKTPSEWRNS